MSLYSSLTQVLAPFAAKINGLLTGWDGTKYSTPGEAIRQQISDLHVLIGDVPGAAIQASAVAYGNSNVSAELDGVNGRLGEQETAIGNRIDVICTDGKYIDPNGNESTSAVSCYTDFIPVVPGETIVLKNVKLNGTRSICAYNANKVKISAIVTGATDTEYTVTVPEGAAYIRATGANGTAVEAYGVNIYATVKKAVGDVGVLSAESADIKGALGDFTPAISATDGYFINNVGTPNPAANSCSTDFIPVIPGMTVTLTNLLLTSARSVCTYASDKSFIKRIAGGSADTSIVYTVGDGEHYLRATGAAGTPPKIVYADFLKALEKSAFSGSSDSVFVSKSGSDTTGDGSKDNPFASVGKAIASGVENIYIGAGVYDEVIDLSKSIKNRLRFINWSNEDKVVFFKSESIVATSESAVEGYTKVYSVQTDKTFNANNLWLYQDGVADERTLITPTERHPAQRGRTHRNLDTKIIKCTATTLNDALAEIEASEDYKWFINSGTLYFSRPQTVTADNPICGGFGHTLFVNNKPYHSVEMYGIDTKYMSINLNNMKSAKAVDCSANGVFGAGAFTYSSRSTTLVRCEAANCVNGANGDGFNGAASVNGNGSQNTTELIDCWAHDNHDDGYSDHNRSDAVMRGGLYEYNVKAGVTPSYGENFAAYNVLSRENVRGFLLTGNIAGGSKNTSAMLYNCIACDNTMNGFSINAPGGGMTLYNCVTIRSADGFRAETESNITLIDCGTSDVTNSTNGNGVITTIRSTKL